MVDETVRDGLVALALVVNAFGLYLMLSIEVSWDSKGEFNNLTTVTAPAGVIVEIPLASVLFLRSTTVDLMSL